MHPPPEVEWLETIMFRNSPSRDGWRGCSKVSWVSALAEMERSALNRVLVRKSSAKVGQNFIYEWGHFYRCGIYFRLVLRSTTRYLFVNSWRSISSGLASHPFCETHRGYSHFIQLRDNFPLDILKQIGTTVSLKER